MKKLTPEQLYRERKAISNEHRRTAEQRHARAINLTGTTAKVVVIGVLLVALLWVWHVKAEDRMGNNYPIMSPDQPAMQVW